MCSIYDGKRGAVQLWKRVVRKVKGKCIRDLDISLSEVSSVNLQATSIGVGDLATRKHSVGSSTSMCKQQEQVGNIPNNVASENRIKERRTLPWKGKGKERAKATKAKVKERTRANYQQIKKMNIQMRNSDPLNNLV